MRECKVKGCNNISAKKEMCNAHYLRLSRYGRLHSVIREKGLGSVSSHGYRVITADGSQVYEHIFKAEKALGRKIPKGCKVHLVDGDKANLSNSNLVVCEDTVFLARDGPAQLVVNPQRGGTRP